MVLPQFVHDSVCCVEFWVNTSGYEWSPIFVIRIVLAAFEIFRHMLDFRSSMFCLGLG